LLCSLVHKFGPRGVEDFEAYVKALEATPDRTAGEIYVFVDECHRTQSGKLHTVMKTILRNAIFIGFTGTPLLKRDRATSLEVFGSYIHTYKFGEAVEDHVVLDLIYEARDIDQKLGSPDKIEAWFAAKTKGLNQWRRDELKKRWGTMQAVLSSASRIGRIVADVVFDFSVKPRLSRERGNAMLVASSIPEACRYYEAFQKTELKGRCAIITSYDPQAKDVTKEETGANTQTGTQFVYDTYKALLEGVVAKPGKSKTETYEDEAKRLFIKEPANMKLLIVVDKLLTGFDAPTCTYLYIDKTMQDHGLFQAICRTNRLDGDDKDFGYIVDYQRLLKKVEKAIAVYTSEIDASAGGADPAVMLKDRLEAGKAQLEKALEEFELHLEPVESPKGPLEHIHWFCGNTEKPSDLEEREPYRSEFYKAVASLVRAFANLSDELSEAGFAADAVARIKARVEHAVNVRDVVRNAAGETLDFKAYEADMRHLIDTYIDAEEPRKISEIDGIGLLDLIVKSGIADAIAKKLSGVGGDDRAVAESIENNVRATIVKKQMSDPALFERLSDLLAELIKRRKEQAIDYEAYLKELEALIKKIDGSTVSGMPQAVNSPAKRALFGALGNDEALALKLDEVIRTKRPADCWGHETNERLLKRAMYDVLGDADEVERLFAIAKQQSEYR
jgi:type I restriction enzyme R subunit